MVAKVGVPLSCSGEATKVITNSAIHQHAEAAFSEFKELSKKFGGFSFWNGPKHFVASETEHGSDGLHLAWPGTLEEVNQVIIRVDAELLK